ncbi:MAG: hypothetical protein K6U74_19935 [Firmicutes bacterium]|nr:hypothetical protein [Bacillota bacterium]
MSIFILEEVLMAPRFTASMILSDKPNRALRPKPTITVVSFKKVGGVGN